MKFKTQGTSVQAATQDGSAAKRAERLAAELRGRAPHGSPLPRPPLSQAFGSHVAQPSALSRVRLAPVLHGLILLEAALLPSVVPLR